MCVKAPSRELLATWSRLVEEGRGAVHPLPQPLERTAAPPRGVLLSKPASQAAVFKVHR